MSEQREVSKPPVLFKNTQATILEAEKLLGGKMICYWNSVNGAICSNDVTAIYEIIKDLPKQEKIFLFIKSDGGNGKASLRIINLLRQHTNRITALITNTCASAATMMALGADEIQMGPLAFLSAVDTSLTHDLSPVDKDNDRVSVSQDELSRVIRLWNEEVKKKEGVNPYQDLYQHIHPLVIGAVDRASSLSIKLCKEILSYHMQDEEKADQISHQLNSDYPSHSYPITLKEAKKIGLNVVEMSKPIHDILHRLNELYSEMGQRAFTDYDEFNYHNHEINNILEVDGTQIYFQNNKDWHYRAEERRWVPMNDQSGWIKVKLKDNEVDAKPFFIR